MKKRQAKKNLRKFTLLQTAEAYGKTAATEPSRSSSIGVTAGLLELRRKIGKTKTLQYFRKICDYADNRYAR